MATSSDSPQLKDSGRIKIGTVSLRKQPDQKEPAYSPLHATRHASHTESRCRHKETAGPCPGSCLAAGNQQTTLQLLSHPKNWLHLFPLFA